MNGHDILEKIAIRISRDKSKVSGTGFYINEKEVATCYHVLASDKEAPQDCYYIKHDKWIEWKEATPECWDLKKDMAVLSCPCESIREIAIPFAEWDKNIADFLSRGYDNKTTIDGGATVVSGTIQSLTSKKGEPRLQLQTAKGTLLQGRSGSPIWNKDAIVGMIDYRAGDENILAEKSTAIPIEVLASKVKIGKRPPAIPVVVVAMNKEEASILKKGKLNDAKNRILFNQFKKALKKHKLADWESFYGDSREEWRPLIYQDKCIYEIITNTINKINEKRRASGSPEINCNNLTNKFFDSEKQKEIYSELGKSGGIMIIDPISLFHPSIRDIVVKSQLFSEPIREKLSILIVSPIDHSQLSPNCIIENLINSSLPTIIDIDFGGLGDIEISGVRILQRMLYDFLQIADHNIRNQLSAKEQYRMKNLGHIRGIFGEPRGIDKFISFTGGQK